MGDYINEHGDAVQVDDDYAARMGYRPVTASELTAVGQAMAEKQARDNSGVLGAARAGVSNLASGATLGATDWLLGQFLDPSEKKQLLTDISAHPTVSGVANLAGAVLPSLAAPESLAARTPAGYLGRAAMSVAEPGFAAGGIAGAARVAGAFGAEGAIQNVGSYLGATALEDKDATAEGALGAAGLGLAFGAGGGAAGLAIEKGTIAARKLFARTITSPEVADAASAWAKTYGETQKAAEESLATAKKQLSDISQAKIEAVKDLQAKTEMRKAEQLRAQQAVPAPRAAEPAVAPLEGPVPLDEGISPPQGGGQTTVFQRPVSGEINPAEAAAFDASLPTPNEGPTSLDEGISPPRGGGKTTVFQRPTTLEQQLAGTKAQLDEGKALKDIGSAPLSFGEAVQEAAAKAQAFGERKAFISSVYENMPPALKPATLDEFKQQLLKAHKSGDIVLARADLVSAMDPKLVAASELNAGPADFHFVVRGEGESANAVRERPSMYGEDVAPGAAVSPQIPPEAVPPARAGRNPSSSIEDWLAEKAAFDAGGELSQVRKIEDIRGQRQYQSFAEMQHARTSELLGPKIADREMALNKYVSEVEAAKAPMDAMEKAAESSITSEQLATLRADNGTNGGKPAHARQRIMDKLESAQEHAVDAAAEARAAGDEVAASDWEQQAQHVEDLMNSLPPEKDIYWDLGDKIKIVDRFEEALSKAPDALGEDAHPLLQEISKQRAAANDDAVRKMSERSVRAAEDAQHFGPEYKTPKERVSYAQEREAESRQALGKLKTDAMQAQQDIKGLAEKVSEGNKARKAAEKADRKAAAAAAKTQKAKDWGSLIGGGAEILNIPGIPKPSDLPVIGPLVGAWLKYRAIKAAFRRVGGRIPFSGDAKVAAFAAKTEGRVAKAVDSALGLAETGTKSALGRRLVPNAARILGTRIYNDGGENPPAGAGIQQQAAARMREISAYVASPNAIEMDVRLKLHDVSDPDVIAAVEKQRRAVFMYLASKLPPMPPPNPLNPQPWVPSGAEAMAFARRMTAVDDPASVFERIAADKPVGMEEMETIRDLYAKTYEKAQQRLMEGMTRLQVPVPLRRRVIMSLLYQTPLDPALSSDNLKISQSVYERKMIAPAPTPTQPPTPSIAQPTNMTALFTNPLDRMR